MLAVPRRISSLALVVLLGLTATTFGACGNGGSDNSKKLLSQTAASRLNGTLDEVDRLVAAGDCTSASAASTQLNQQVGALPARVDPKLRDALASSAVRLQRLVENQCKPAGPTTSTPPPAPSQQTPKENQQKKQNKAKGPKQKGPKDNGTQTEPTQPEPTPQGDGQGNGDSGGSGGGPAGVTP
jgi:hypothetical protein